MTQTQIDFTALTARARTADPETSHEAAAQVEASGVANDQRSRCLTEVRRLPGQTCGEIASHIGLDRHATGKRLPELRDAGLVKNGGTRICLEQGSRQMVWEPTDLKHAHGTTP
jgi:hypothetical protein